MIFVLAAGALIIVGMVVITAIGIASAIRGTLTSVALAGGALLVVTLGVVVVATVGIGGGQQDSTPTAATTKTTVTTTMTTTTVTPTPVPRDAIDGREVHMRASTPDTYGSLPPVVDELPRRSVLRITATGFEPNSAGLVEQCTVAGCANPFSVVFDATGRARLQYLVGDAFATNLAPQSTCRADEPPCFVHLRSNGDAAFLTTVFRDVAPAPRRVVVDPNAGGLVDGAPVRVAVTGFTPGEVVQAMLCVAPDTYGSTRCGAPGPVAPFTIDADGTGRTALVIRAGRVGSDGASCDRGATCGIVVSHPMSSVPAPVFPLTFAAGPGAQYDAPRWLTGLAVAIVLLALAFFLARKTDWRKPTEADTPDLDRAALSA